MTKKIYSQQKVINSLYITYITPERLVRTMTQVIITTRMVNLNWNSKTRKGEKRNKKCNHIIFMDYIPLWTAINNTTKIRERRKTMYGKA